METPINSTSNQNECLIQSAPNRQQNLNVDQFFVENTVQSFEQLNTFVIKSTPWAVIILSILVLLGCTIPALVIPGLVYYLRIIIISPGVIISLLLFTCCKKKIILIKDTSNRKVLIKVMNYLCFPKMKFNLDIENTHFYIRRETYQDAEGYNEYTSLLIFNDYKNLVDIDLDKSNIKQKPAKFLYSFDNIYLGIHDPAQFTHILNDFIGNDSNQLYFNKYLDIKKNYCFSSNQDSTLREYMVFSDHFFTYHLKAPLSTSCSGICFIIIACFINLCTISAAIPILVSENAKIHIKIVVVIFILIGIIIVFILHKIFKYCFGDVFRIDCIYSNNFDRLFIGLVKLNKTKYVNTFEYKMDDISRFILEREGNNYKLKVVFKNNETQEIYTIKKKTKEELGRLALLLNERLNINSNNNI
jgi:hypothetical protein